MTSLTELCFSHDTFLQRFQMDAEREKKDGAFTTEEQLEELNTENMFLKRELDYAEKKLAGLGAGDAEDGDDAAGSKGIADSMGEWRRPRSGTTIP